MCSITGALGYSIAGIRNRQLELLLKRYRQLCPSVKRATRHPVTYPILLSLLQHVPSIIHTHIAASTLTALLLSLFFGFFRPGELLCRGLDHTSPPTRAAVMHSTLHSTLHLLASKTDLFHVGCDIHLPRLGGVLCPVGAIPSFRAWPTRVFNGHAARCSKIPLVPRCRTSYSPQFCVCWSRPQACLISTSRRTPSGSVRRRPQRTVAFQTLPSRPLAGGSPFRTRCTQSTLPRLSGRSRSSCQLLL